jgi:uncharacterized protein YneF (UPF0154 family)
MGAAAGSHSGRLWKRWRSAIGASVLGSLGNGGVVHAQPTLEEVFKGISDGVNKGSDPTMMLGVLAGVAGVVCLLVFFNRRKTRKVAPRPRKNPSKLVRVMSRQIGLKPAEVRQLRNLADDRKLISPLTLILSPTLLGQALEESKVRVDRKALASLARKLKDAAKS